MFDIDIDIDIDGDLAAASLQANYLNTMLPERMVEYLVED